MKALLTVCMAIFSFSLPAQKNHCGSADHLLFQDYMAGTHDACMCFFTPGQKQRMPDCLNTYKSSLINSAGCALVMKLGTWNEKGEIDLSEYPPGIYMVTLLSDEGLSFSRIVKN